MKRTPLKRTEFKWKPRSRVTKTRTILYGPEYAALRLGKAIAANECCEQCGRPARYTQGMPGLYDGQLCHKERGANRSSEPDRVWWGCKSCHDIADGRDYGRVK